MWHRGVAACVVASFFAAAACGSESSDSANPGAASSARQARIAELEREERLAELEARAERRDAERRADLTRRREQFARLRARRESEAPEAVNVFMKQISDGDLADAFVMLGPQLRADLGGIEGFLERYGAVTSMFVGRASATVEGPGLDRATVPVDYYKEEIDACGEEVSSKLTAVWRLGRSGGRWRIDRVSGVRRIGGVEVVAREVEDCANRDEPLIDSGCGGSFQLDAVTIPAIVLPAYVDSAGVHHEEKVVIEARTIPARTIELPCAGATGRDEPLDLEETSVLADLDEYRRLDSTFSASLTRRYWSRAGTASFVPDFAARGYGTVNAAGFPRDQYVRPYVRRDGTPVSGYWRNSPTDGLPTCRVIRC